MWYVQIDKNERASETIDRRDKGSCRGLDQRLGEIATQCLLVLFDVRFATTLSKSLVGRHLIDLCIHWLLI